MPSDPQNNFRPGDDENVILRKILDRLSGIALGATTSYVDAGDAATLAASKASAASLYVLRLQASNVFIGAFSGQFNTGTNNNGVGDGSLASNTTGGDNNALGKGALLSNVTGNRNSAVGQSASSANTSGNDNVAIGSGALIGNTTGGGDIGIGRNTLSNLNIVANDGSGQNTAIGYNTGLGIVTGINNTIVGANVVGLAASLSNNIIFSDGAGNIRLQSDSTGFWTFSNGFSYKMTILPEAANYPIVAADSGKVLTNTGAGGAVTFTLPASAVGLHYFFSVEVAASFVIKAVGADIIQIAGAASSAAGTATNATVGSTLHLICSKAGKWVSFAREGTWTLA